MQSRNTNNKKGIDVSHWQGEIDFKKVKAAGIDFVYIKLTDKDNYIDPTADKNYKAAKEAGLEVGFYHFGRFTSNATAQAEATFFKSKLANYDCDLPPVLDLEVNVAHLKPDFLSQAVLAFKQVIGDMVLYSGAAFAKANFTDVLKDIPLWVAHYGVDTPMGNNVWDKWFMFQYTSQGTVDGINGHVDLDEMDVEGCFCAGNCTCGAMKQVKSEAKPASQPKTEPAHVAYETYKIKKGDTFWSLAQGKNYTAQDIQRVNPHVDPTKLHIGQIINLPVKQASKPKYKLPSGTLKKGDKGDAVKQLQTALNAAHFNCGAVDGVFGAKTEDALRRFQSVYDAYHVDGVYGSRTHDALNRLLNK